MAKKKKTRRDKKREPVDEQKEGIKMQNRHSKKGRC